MLFTSILKVFSMLYCNYIEEIALLLLCSCFQCTKIVRSENVLKTAIPLFSAIDDKNPVMERCISIFFVEKKIGLVLNVQ